MRVLFIGGTGIISSACTELALARGYRVTLLNRGRRGGAPAGAEVLQADVQSAEAERALAGRTFDAVVNFIAFTPADVERDVRRFAGRCGQYVLISSASVYQKPQTHYLITESTPLANPLWEYSRNKIAAEETLVRAHRELGFPGVIVRPSLTYGDTLLPIAVNAWHRPWTVAKRMRAGKKVIVPGDGSSLWTITHASDFAKGLVGLLGHQQTPGHAFHITSDEVLTWDQIYAALAAALGVPLNPIHIASDFLAATFPDLLGSLQGDKAVSVVFDNSKIRRFVPDFVATTRFSDGIRRSVAWFEADPARQAVDERLDRQWDALIAAYEAGQAAAVRAVAEVGG